MRKDPHFWAPVSLPKLFRPREEQLTIAHVLRLQGGFGSRPNDPGTWSFPGVLGGARKVRIARTEPCEVFTVRGMRLRGARLRGGDDILIAHAMILTHPEALFTIALFLGIPNDFYVSGETGTAGFHERNPEAIIANDVKHDLVDRFFYRRDPELLPKCIGIFAEGEVIVCAEALQCSGKVLTNFVEGQNIEFLELLKICHELTLP